MTDPLNQPASSDTTWTTVNVAEAIPGVPTPLTWTWEWAPMEASCRGTFVDLGALPQTGNPYPRSPTTPSSPSSAAALQSTSTCSGPWATPSPADPATRSRKKVFGSVRSDMASRANLRRYPVVAAKLVPSAIRARRRLLGHVADTDRWWRPRHHGHRSGPGPGTTPGIPAPVLGNRAGARHRILRRPGHLLPTRRAVRRRRPSRPGDDAGYLRGGRSPAGHRPVGSRPGATLPGEVPRRPRLPRTARNRTRGAVLARRSPSAYAT